jgi:hypothetical protein
MSVAIKICEHNNVTIYTNCRDILVAPSQMTHLTGDELIDFVKWCNDHEKEIIAIETMERCLNSQSIMIQQLADWIINKVASSELADERIKNVAQHELIRRKTFQTHGAPQKKTGANQKGPGYVYVIQAGPYYKIGVSRKVSRRIRQLSTLPPFDLELVCTIKTDDMFALERTLHEKFSSKRINGEWFSLSDSDVQFIKSL